jgi:hypothetical protein
MIAAPEGTPNPTPAYVGHPLRCPTKRYAAGSGSLEALASFKIPGLRSRILCRNAHGMT